MKIFKWAAFVLTALSLNAAVAQQADSSRTRLTPDQRADKITSRLKQELTLSDDQSQKVRAIILEQENQRQQGMEKRKAIHEQLQKSLTGVLTPEQLEKYKKMQADRKEKMKGHGHHGKPMPPDSNPPQSPEEK